MCHGPAPFLSPHLASCFISQPQGQRQACLHKTLHDHNLFEAGISPEKLGGICPEGDVFIVSSSFPACFWTYTGSWFFFPLSCLSHKTGNKPYSVWISASCCAFNFKPHVLLFRSSFFSTSVLNSCLCLFPSFSFALGYTSVQCSNWKEKSSVLANSVYYLLLSSSRWGCF